MSTLDTKKGTFTNKKRKKEIEVKTKEEKLKKCTSDKQKSNCIDHLKINKNNKNNDNDNDIKLDNNDPNEYNSLINDESKIGEIEYTKNLIKALKEAIDENDKLRQYAIDLTKENEEMKKEINAKNGVIEELAYYYQVRYYCIICFSFVKTII